MNMQEVKNFAIKRGVNPGKLNKVTLIRAIQRKEGNFDCFATAISGFCDQDTCLWRRDCFEAAATQSNPVGSNGANGTHHKREFESLTQA